ncbi:uncharacterized protein EV422DRAFT_509147 [Fimicolochytrium jonesii]|uniref:uncharacterized protein n=1 Tax=Fimicolochytrium jonesii TaxID=1396493 RepID=UPI0022FDF2EE|nr:uncharacterized protein EV422DRAFT_509147 [Fimicolochytrium jonesii]KAI8817321.1 hypothetical protein EV422DRAFT_509147 [Fimicolochytrium jonesii]
MSPLARKGLDDAAQLLAHATLPPPCHHNYAGRVAQRIAKELPPHHPTRAFIADLQVALDMNSFGEIGPCASPSYYTVALDGALASAPSARGLFDIGTPSYESRQQWSVNVWLLDPLSSQSPVDVKGFAMPTICVAMLALSNPSSVESCVAGRSPVMREYCWPALSSQSPVDVKGFASFQLPTSRIDAILPTFHGSSRPPSGQE